MTNNEPDQDDDKKKPANLNLNNMILGGLKSRTGKETSRWLADLSDVKNAAEAAAAAMEEPKETPTQHAAATFRSEAQAQQNMIAMLDAMFDCFQQYEYDFNKSMQGTNLVVHIERPSRFQESVGKGYNQKVVDYFKGRVSTREWTLLLKGQEDQIEGYILPIEKLISFTAAPQDFSRYLVMQAFWRGGEATWCIDEVPVPPGELRGLTKQFFGSLIQVARSDSGEVEAFSLKPRGGGDRGYDQTAGSGFGASSVSGSGKPVGPPGFSFEKDEPRSAMAGAQSGSMHSVAPAPAAPTAPAAEAPPAQAQTRATTGRTRSRAAAKPPAQQPPVESPPAETPPQQPVRPPSGPMFASPPPQGQPGNDPRTPTAPMPPQSPQSPQPPTAPSMPTAPAPPRTPTAPLPPQAPAAPTQPAQIGGNMDFTQVSTALLGSVDKELERLTQAGMQAFASQDLQGVEKAMHKSSRLKALRGQMESTLKQWQASLAED